MVISVNICSITDSLSVPGSNNFLCQHGNCVDGECLCNEDWAGKDCSIQVNSCKTTSICPSGNCTKGNNNETCLFDVGQRMSVCSYENPQCYRNETEHNGSLTADYSNNFVCDEDMNYTLTLDCSHNPCLNNGTCLTENNTFICICTENYYGGACNKYNDCESSPCENGGICNDLNNAYNCTCVDGFNGTNCENDTRACASDPCKNGGSCNDHINGYNCTCLPGYDGVNCNNDINECASDLTHCN